jgi:nucleotide-binding universal stress UspA family protein
MVITCGIHPTPAAEHAAAYAARLASERGARLELVHVIRARAVLATRRGTGVPLSMHAPGVSDRAVGAERHLQALAADLAERHDVEVTWRLDAGHPAARLAAAALRSDLLVIGTQSRRRPWGDLRATVRRGLLRRVPDRLLIVPDDGAHAGQISPWASMASATRENPEMFAPLT